MFAHLLDHTNDILIAHPSASRGHAMLLATKQTRHSRPEQEAVPSHLFLVDLHSANGTFVNGVAVSPACAVQISPIDSVSFGASHRMYVN